MYNSTEDGIPSAPVIKRLNGSRDLTLRGAIWKILLRVRGVSAETYLELVAKREYQTMSKQ
jgi:hypothetical protein